MDLKTPKLRKPGRWTVTAGVALISLGLLSFNAFATFTATATATHATDTGDMEITLAGAGANHRIATPSANIVPGDTIQRTVQVTIANEGGTMGGGAFTGGCTGACSQSFLTDDTNGLQIWIARCSVAWTEDTASPYTYSCSGTATDVLGTSGAPVNFDNQASATLSNFPTTDGAVNYLMVKLTFPTAAPDSMENQGETLELTFEGTQRAGTDQ